MKRSWKRDLDLRITQIVTFLLCPILIPLVIYVTWAAQKAAREQGDEAETYFANS